MGRWLYVVALLVGLSTTQHRRAQAADGSLYVSPGMGLSWNVGHGLTFGVKVSLG